MSDELDFIESLRALATHPAARNLEDDAAVLKIGHETLIITHDTMVENVHFLPDQDPADIAWKLVAVNLSDLAAKGAKPIGVLLSHQVSDADERFIAGLREVLVRYDVALLGGDTTRSSGPRSLGLTAIGSATYTPVPDRRSARPDDSIFVTGTLGKAMLGLEGRLSGSIFADAYTRPIPRLTEGPLLAPHVSAMMDISDGLLLDAWRMARASGCSFHLDRKAVPVADPARYDDCIRWGDDYELLFTLPPSLDCPVPATQIGTVREGGIAPLWLDNTALTLPDGLGYQH